jgi:hypothetical protein
MLVEEQWINQTKNYIIGDSGEYEPYTENLNELFKSYQKENGRCISKVYIDTKDKQIIAVGWVFEKKVKYTDCDDYYIQHTWITLYKKKTKIIDKHYYMKIG